MQRTVGKYAQLKRCIGATKRIFMIMDSVSNIAPFGGDLQSKPMECIYGYDDPDTLNTDDKGNTLQTDQPGTHDLYIPMNGFRGDIEFRNVWFQRCFSTSKM